MGLGDLRQRGFRSGRPKRRSDAVSLSRILGEGEDPLTWSLPVFVSRRLRVRVHFVFVLLALWGLILSAPHGGIGPVHVFIAVGALLVLVGAREIGRWLWIQRMGPAPEQIVLWPLGLLAAEGFPRLSRPSVIAAGAGLAVNVALAPLFAGALWAAGQGWDALLFNPFAPDIVLSGIGSIGVAVLWWFYYLNLVLLGLNLLLPMLPLDGARILEAVLARRLNPGRAAAAVCRVGLLTALVLFVAAMSADLTRLMGLAVFGAGVCWIHLRRVEFVQEPVVRSAMHSGRAETREKTLGALPPLLPPVVPPMGKPVVTDDSAEVDRILAKISSSGLNSLSSGEKRALAAATERRRKEQAGIANHG